MFINCITLTTGHNARTSREGVPDDVLVIVEQWLLEIINTDQRSPLPVEKLSHYSAVAFEQEGGLMVTVYGPLGQRQQDQPAIADIPLVTFGIAQKPHQAESLWAVMLANFDHPADIKQPSTPWCAVVMHSTIISHRDAMPWIAEFERCVAWAWIMR